MKNEFKLTEIGVIPEEWEVKCIGEIATPVRGGSPRPAGDPKYFNGNYIPWLTVAALTNIPVSQIYVTSTDSFLTEKGSLHSRMLEKGTLIIANSGATLGVAKILGLECCANDGIAALQNVDDNIDKTYLVYFINSKIRYLREVVATGNGQPNLNTGLISAFKIPLPPLLEQTAIATALSDMDALLAQTEKILQKKKAIKQGLMQELLKPKEGWVVKRLGEVFEFYPTANYSKAEMSPVGEIGCIHYGLIHAIPDTNYSLESGVKFHIESDRTRYELVKDGDVVMVDASEDLVGVNKSVEVFGVGNRKFIAGLHTYLMRDIHSTFVDNLRGQILNSVFVKNQMLKLAVGMKVFGVSKPQLKQVLLPIPPKDTQTRIAQILTDADAAIQALETKIAKLQAQKQGMMQALLTGKIRLTA